MLFFGNKYVFRSCALHSYLSYHNNGCEALGYDTKGIIHGEGYQKGFHWSAGTSGWEGMSADVPYFASTTPTWLGLFPSSLSCYVDVLGKALFVANRQCLMEAQICKMSLFGSFERH